MASRMARHVLLFSLFLLINQIHAEDKIISIKTPEDLIKFSNLVNNGKGFFQGTVTLENDLDMSEVSSSFNPIGFNGGQKTFQGTFDGKGHVISNLTLNFNNILSIGLFGYSYGMTLKNTVLDESCTMASISTDQESPFYYGAFIGVCVSNNYDCVLKNLVSMATLSACGFNYAGGIIGFLESYSSRPSSCVINCLNFGTIEFEKPVKFTHFGGIVGLVTSENNNVFVQNCANYGKIIDLSDSVFVFGIGGIVGGLGDNTVIQNCVNMGDFVGDQRQHIKCIGSIVGTSEANTYVKIENCYWLKGAYSDKEVGRNTGKFIGNSVKESTSFSRDLSFSSPVDVSRQQRAKVTDALNSFPNGEFEKWVALDLNGGRIARMDNYLPRIPVLMGKNVFVNPTKDGYIFKGWYLDSMFKTKLDLTNELIPNVGILYAKWGNSMIVTFVFDTIRVKKEININHYIEYPRVKVSRGHRGEWCTRGKEVCNPVTSDKDIELYFFQTPNEYTFSFHTSGSKQIGPRAIPFGEMIGELPVPEKEGCEFLGWFTDPELKYPFYAERMPDNDTVIHAKWNCSQNPKAAEIKAMSCFNTSEFDEWVIMGFDEKEHAKNKKYLAKAPVFGNRKALKKLKKGCVFRGWYLDPGLKSTFNPETDDISEVAALYAKWGYYVKVTFIFPFDSKRVAKNVMSGEAIEYPDVEVSRGHKAEWCTRGKKVCNPVTSDKDIELYFIQSPKEYILSFNTSGGKQIGSRVIGFDKFVRELPVPEKEGYEFLGWFADPELKYPFYTKRMPSNDTVIHAKWRNVSKEGKTFARLTAFACIVLSVAGTWIVFAKRSVIGLKSF